MKPISELTTDQAQAEYNKLAPFRHGLSDQQKERYEKLKNLLKITDPEEVKVKNVSNTAEMFELYTTQGTRPVVHITNGNDARVIDTNPREADFRFLSNKEKEDIEKRKEHVRFMNPALAAMERVQNKIDIKDMIS